MQINEFLWPEALAAIDAATWAAIRKARQTGTNLVVCEGGKIIQITPDQAEMQMLADEQHESSVPGRA